MIQALEGEDAVQKNRDLMAPPTRRRPTGTIRADFADSIDANAVHGSDAPETAAVEIAYFFPRARSTRADGARSPRPDHPCGRISSTSRSPP